MTTDISKLFKIELTKPVCLEGFSEDNLRELVDALRVSFNTKEFRKVVTIIGDIETRVSYGSDGNFAGIFALIDGASVPIVHGTGSSVLGIFKGAPSATNPGVGWQVEPTLTTKYLGQSGPESGWDIFFASRKSVINT